MIIRFYTLRLELFLVGHVDRRIVVPHSLETATSIAFKG